MEVQKESDTPDISAEIPQERHHSILSETTSLEDDNAWMNDDMVLFGGDDDEEDVVPFGLNQSWPRVSRLSSRQKMAPSVAAQGRKLLRQVSQESLDESTNLLLGHIVMLGDIPQETSFPAFTAPSLVEEEEEEGEEGEGILQKVERLKEGDESVEVNKAQEPKSTLVDNHLSALRDDDLQTISSSLRQNDLAEDLTKAHISERLDAVMEEGNRLDKPPSEGRHEAWAEGGSDAHVGRLQNQLGDIKRVEPDIEIVPISNETSHHVFKPISEEKDLAIVDHTQTQGSVLSDEASKTNEIEVENSDCFGKDISIGSTDVQRNVKKISLRRKRPPLLHHISQESIEESTSLLLDHVVMMDLQANVEGKEDKQVESNLPFLMDISENPLIDGAAIPGKAEEEEERYLYRDDVDSSEDEEGNEGEKDKEDDTCKEDSLPSLAELASSRFISEEAKTTLKDIELIRVELDNAIQTFQNLSEDFPERAADMQDIPNANDDDDGDIALQDVEDEIDDEAEVDYGSFVCLPDELIHYIFQYFSHTELCNAVMLTCKKWCLLAQDPLLWKHLDLSKRAGSPPEILAGLLRRCSLLQSVTFRGREEVSQSEVCSVVEYCPDIRHLDFGFVTNLRDDIISLLVGRCQRLRSVNMEGCDQVTDRLISRLILLQGLKVLNLSHCTKLTDGAVFEIARFCDGLEHLDIDGIPWITDEAVMMLCAERGSTLQCLRLDGAELNNRAVQHAVQCVGLQELNISFCEQLTDPALQMLKAWKQPRRLRLQKGKEFSATALADLFVSPHLSNLTFLDLSECSELRDPGLLNIANRCPLLSHLAVEWCWFITDVSLVQVVDNCRFLKHLDLIGLHAILGHCLEDVPTKLPLLEFLDLRQCNRITDAMLVKIVFNKHNLVIMNYYGEEVTHDNIPGTLDL